MKGYRRQNVAKPPAVETLFEIPTKTIYGIAIVTLFTSSQISSLFKANH